MNGGSANIIFRHALLRRRRSMKSKVIILVLTLVLLVLIGISTTVASWAKFNTFNLVQNSDVILLGKIVGPVVESKGVATE